MINKNRIWFSLILLIALLTLIAIDQHAAQGSIGMRADGTAPACPAHSEQIHSQSQSDC